jgi:hypothetical protein
MFEWTLLTRCCAGCHHAVRDRWPEESDPGGVSARSGDEDRRPIRALDGNTTWHRYLGSATAG